MAAEPAFDQGPVLSLTEENDFVNDTDRWNTQTAQISFLQAENHVPHWTGSFLEAVPALGFTPASRRIGYQLGQSMFTPEDTHASPPPPEDRPYAGWLYGGLVLQRRGPGLGGLLSTENLTLQLGMIGPESFADNVQTWYHHRAPRGWDYQIKDEPGIALKYGRAWLIRLPDPEQPWLDFIPQGGVSAGNVDTSFRAGALLRAGWNLPADFGVQPIDSLLVSEGGWSPSQDGRRWGFYFFTGVEGRAVLYNAFLDGNAFRESPSVHKKPWVGEWRSGLVLLLSRVELAYTHVYRSREFRGQPEGQVYGSLSLRMKF